MKTTVTEGRPGIEYPRRNETITSSHYSFRIGAPAAVENVDVSIDQGAWLACRKAAGHWWFDWSQYADGEHEIIARIRGKNGRWLMSPPHEFIVKIP
ncbi:MAG: hypothetical protein AAB036_09335 [Elusimicrobiota bacterium]